MITKKNRIYVLLGTTTGILLIPLIAMQFTNEVNWDASDFLVAAILLFGVCSLIELSIRNIKDVSYRTPIIIGIIVLLLLVWMELGDGIFGTPFAGD